MPSNKERFSQIPQLRIAIAQQTKLIYRMQRCTRTSVEQDIKLEKIKNNLIGMKKRLRKRLRWGIERINTMENRTDKADAERCALYKVILYQRYYQAASWQDIAELTGYSQRQCRRLHDLALENI